jgi:hypothetical protein
MRLSVSTYLEDSMSAKLEKVKNHPGIYRRGSAYVVTWRDRSGKQRRKSEPTLAAARDRKAKERNRRGPTQRIRFAAYAPLWLEGYRGRTGEGIGTGTLADYATGYRRTRLSAFASDGVGERTRTSRSRCWRSTNSRGSSTW